MKILSIGDIHGRDIWKTFGDISILMKSNGSFKPDYDKYVFIGDYCDSFTLSHVEILHNLNEIIRFKKMYPEYVILLLGNHDVQYFLRNPFGHNDLICSGYNSIGHVDYYDIYRKNRFLFQMAYQYKNYLFSHSFVSSDWYRYSFRDVYFDFVAKLSCDIEMIMSRNLGEALNTGLIYELEPMFMVGSERYGPNKYGGPLWEDIKRVDNAILLYHQIVGHTPVKEIRTHILGKNTSVTFIDVLAHKDSFYTVNIPTD